MWKCYWTWNYTLQKKGRDPELLLGCSWAALGLLLGCSWAAPVVGRVLLARPLATALAQAVWFTLPADALSSLQQREDNQGTFQLREEKV